MTNPTSNFGWQMPTASDLVTDLPADFETFGQAVDTSLADLKGGTSGQILAKASNTDMDFTWVTNDVGDITAVTAGTGITGGGTSGAVTVSFDQANYGGGQYAAGKNHIINGDFNIWQRGTSFSNPLANSFTADRFLISHDGTGATRTISRQAFTPGTAPVAGYEGNFFYRYAFTAVGTGNSYCTAAVQRIEDVTNFAGQTVTFSFWAKNDSSKSFTVFYQQVFGSGGSGAVSGNTAVTIGTSWARYSVTFAIPSIAGKTIGSSSYLEFYIADVAGTRATFTLDMWGWQVEAGSTATPFQTATGTIQGELAACKRYYRKSYAAGTAPATATTDGAIFYKTAFTNSYQQFYTTFDVEMRTTPTITFYSTSNGATGQAYNGITNVAVTAAGQIGTSSMAPYINNVSQTADLVLKTQYQAEAEL